MSGADRLIDGLSKSSKASEETGHPAKDIRPCIMTLKDTSLTKGNFPNRNESAVIIASEYKRIGKGYDYTQRELEKWNENNNPPLKPNELRNTVRSAFAHDYNYSCKNPILLDFCINKDSCPYWIHVISKRPFRKEEFIKNGWQQYLSNRQVLIYAVALPNLEKKRRIGRGGLICANHKQIAETCGISPGRVGKDLRILSAVGLIEYNVGIPRKWEGIASEIKRVFPVPRPTRELTQKLKRFKNDTS